MIGRLVGLLAERCLRAVTAAHSYGDDVLADLDDTRAQIAECDGADAAGRWYASQAIRSLVPLTRTSEIGTASGLRLAPLAVFGYMLVLAVDGLVNGLIPVSIAVNHPLMYRVAALGWISASGVSATWLVARGARGLSFAANALLLLIAAGNGARYVAVGSRLEIPLRISKVIVLVLTIVVTSLVAVQRPSSVPEETT